MKFFVFVLFNILCSNAMAQNAYKWINFPTLTGTSHIKDARVRDYLLLEGEVKEVESTSIFIGDNEKSIKHVIYHKSGNIDFYERTNLDPESEGGVSSYTKINFDFNESNKLVSESVLTKIEGHIVEEIDSRWPEWFPFLTISTDILYIEKATVDPISRDTMFSVYDEFNRKTMDSIPADRKGGPKKITYRYEGNKVYRNFYWLEDGEDLYQKEEYTLDEKGNWIELKYFGQFNLESEECTELTTRKITYF